MDRTWKRELYRLWKKSKLDYSFSINRKEGGSSGIHYGNKKEIEIRLKALYEDIKKLEERMKMDLSHRDKDVAKYVLGHEIGHALDATLERNKKELEHIHNMIFPFFFQNDGYNKIYLGFEKCESVHIGYEEKAWELAEQFLSEKEKDEVFYAYKEYCLDSYRDTYKKYKKEWLLFLKVTNWISDIKENNTIKMCTNIGFDYVNGNRLCIYYHEERHTTIISVHPIIEKLKKSKDIGQTQKELFFSCIENMIEPFISSFLKWKRRRRKIDDAYDVCEKAKDYKGMKKVVKKEDDLQIDKEKEKMKYVIKLLENHTLQAEYRIHKENEIVELRKKNRESRKKVYGIFNRSMKRQQEQKIAN